MAWCPLRDLGSHEALMCESDAPRILGSSRACRLCLSHRAFGARALELSLLSKMLSGAKAGQKGRSVCVSHAFSRAQTSDRERMHAARPSGSFNGRRLGSQFSLKHDLRVRFFSNAPSCHF